MKGSKMLKAVAQHRDFVNIVDQDTSQTSPEARCLSCIRNVTSNGVDLTKRCVDNNCGPFQISYQYWAEAGKPAISDGASQGARNFEKCARDQSCSELTVRNYFKKYKRDCNNDGLIDCLDMAALHKFGPTTCSSEWLFKSRFWSAFNKTTCATSNRELETTNDDHNQFLKQQHLQQQRHQLQEAAMNLMKNQSLTSECLDCICEAVSGHCQTMNINQGGHNCGSGTICGPFAISQAYWKDGRRPGASWTACTRTKECSSVTVKNYMEKYKRDCNGDGYITCEDYAAIHRRGPKSCMNRDLLKEQYWSRFLACRANQRPMNDANTVKVSDEVLSINLSSRGDSAPTTTVSISQPPPPPATTTSTTTSTTSTTTTTTSTSTTTTTTTSTTPTPFTADDDDMDDIRSNQHQQTHPVPTRPTSQATSPADGASYEPVSLVLDVKAITNHQKAKQQDSYEGAPASTHYDLEQHPSNQRNRHQSSSHQTTPSASYYKSTRPTTMGDNYEPMRKVSPQEDSTRTTVAAFNQHQDQLKPTGTTTNQRRPIFDYSSLPTIIVSKPLGAASTNRVVSLTQQNPLQPSYTTTTTRLTTTGPQTTTIQSAPTRENSDDVINDNNGQPTRQRPQAGAFSAPLDVAGYPLTGLDNSEADYADFPFQQPGQGNFDKMVSGIVTNPDFSKSYPPVPDLRNKKNQLEQQLTGESSNGVSSNRIQPKIMPALTRVASISTGANKPASDSMIKSSGELGPGSIVGADSVNMTNLFEVGLNESSRIASECLECICDASSNCDPTVQCISKQREKNRCGLYMISWNQFRESDISLTSLMAAASSSPPSTTSPTSGGSSGSLGSNHHEDHDEKLYYDCTTDRNCAEKLIHLYIEKHQRDCNNDGKIDCYDIAAIHRVGPDHCNSGKFLSSQYWKDFNICYATDRLTTTIITTTTSTTTSITPTTTMSPTSSSLPTIISSQQASDG